MKVITGNVTTCNGCLTAMEFDESDIIPAIKCPTCSKLIEVNHPLPAIAIDLNSKSWDEIIEILKTKSGKALGLGAKKNITLKNGEFYTVQITHRKDNAVILNLLDLYGTNDGDGRIAMNKSCTTKGGYAKTLARKWLNEDFLALLPDDLAKYIIPTKIDVGNGEFLEDKVFIPSEFELHGRKIHAMYEEGEQFELYKEDWRNRIAGCRDGEYGRWQWTRSVASAEFFCLVNCGGTAGCGGAGYVYYLRPHFQIGI